MATNYCWCGACRALFVDCKRKTTGGVFALSTTVCMYLSLPLPLRGLSSILGHLLSHLVGFQGDLVLQGRAVVGLLDRVSLIREEKRKMRQDLIFSKTRVWKSEQSIYTVYILGVCMHHSSIYTHCSSQ